MLEIIMILNIVISLSIFLGGYYLKFHIKPDDTSVGFRTKNAQSSKETWIFANQSCGKLWLIVGITAFILSIIILIYFNSILSEKAEICVLAILLLLQLFSMCFSIYHVEKQLKKFFDINSSL